MRHGHSGIPFHRSCFHHAAASGAEDAQNGIIRRRFLLDTACSRRNDGTDAELWKYKVIDAAEVRVTLSITDRFPRTVNRPSFVPIPGRRMRYYFSCRGCHAAASGRRLPCVEKDAVQAGDSSRLAMRALTIIDVRYPAS